MSKFIAQMLGQADRVAHSRSSVLVPVQWLLATLAAFFLALLFLRAPNWALIGDGVLIAALTLVSIIIYVYFSLKNPDCLRSEQHSLSKLAIERGLYGDSDIGMSEALSGGMLFETKLKIEGKGRLP